MPTVASKSSWLSPLNKMCCISKTANVLSGEKLCLDMFWIYFTLNDRLTLIPHIFGLSTQWQVHMVCFAEMHPNPASQKFIRIYFFLSSPTRICLLIWSRTRALGNQRHRLQMSGAAVILPRTSHKSCEAESDGFLAQHLPPQDAFLFTWCSCSLNLFILQWCGNSEGEISFYFLHVGAAAVLLQPADTNTGGWWYRGKSRWKSDLNWATDIHNNKDKTFILDGLSCREWPKSSNFKAYQNNTDESVSFLFYISYIKDDRRLKETIDLMLMNPVSLDTVITHCCIMEFVLSRAEGT